MVFNPNTDIYLRREFISTLAEATTNIGSDRIYINITSNLVLNVHMCEMVSK